MYKANGRTSRSTSASRVPVNYKEFACTKCDNRIRVSSVEFGEAVRCVKCGSDMQESYEK